MTTYSQDIKKGKIVTAKFLALSIQDNLGGEVPERKISVYLPAGYNESKQHYPVIYLLLSFLLDDSLMMAYTQIDKLMDAAIAIGAFNIVELRRFQFIGDVLFALCGLFFVSLVVNTR